jgi:hypothetical protein
MSRLLWLPLRRSLTRGSVYVYLWCLEKVGDEHPKRLSRTQYLMGNRTKTNEESGWKASCAM